MKRIVGLFTACMLILLTLCACNGTFGSVDLKDTVSIPDDGAIQERTIAQIKAENAIGVFEGTNADLHYEWTIFGSDITKPKTLNLGVQLQKTDDGLRITLGDAEPFGFSALLSVYLNEQWNAQSATAYNGDTAFVSVSLTGTKTTILNITVDGSVPDFVVRPDPLPEGSENVTASKGATTTTGSQLPTHATQNTTTSNGGKDKYLTDPVPEGKPTPVEPEDQEVNKKQTYTCTFSIECSTILNNLADLDPDKLELVPSNGIILATTTVTFYEGESIFDVLQRLCKEKGIHLESSWTPIYNSAYIEGIHNLYEFDCGSLSGWMYRVNGWYPNYGCSRYQLKAGDVVEWRYTCDLGHDVGGAYAVGG